MLIEDGEIAPDAVIQPKISELGDLEHDGAGIPFGGGGNGDLGAVGELNGGCAGGSLKAENFAASPLFHDRDDAAGTVEIEIRFEMSRRGGEIVGLAQGARETSEPNQQGAGEDS